MKFRPSCSDWFKKVCTKIKRSADIHNSTAPTDFANHLAVRPAPRGAAVGAGGGPPCIKLRLLLKYCKKKGNYCLAAANWGFLEGILGGILLKYPKD